MSTKETATFGEDITSRQDIAALGPNRLIQFFDQLPKLSTFSDNQRREYQEYGQKRVDRYMELAVQPADQVSGLISKWEQKRNEVITENPVWARAIEADVAFLKTRLVRYEELAQLNPENVSTKIKYLGKVLEEDKTLDPIRQQTTVTDLNFLQSRQLRYQNLRQLTLPEAQNKLQWLDKALAQGISQPIQRVAFESDRSYLQKRIERITLETTDRKRIAGMSEAELTAYIPILEKDKGIIKPEKRDKFLTYAQKRQTRLKELQTIMLGDIPGKVTFLTQQLEEAAGSNPVWETAIKNDLTILKQRELTLKQLGGESALILQQLKNRHGMAQLLPDQLNQIIPLLKADQSVFSADQRKDLLAYAYERKGRYTYLEKLTVGEIGEKVKYLEKKKHEVSQTDPVWAQALDAELQYLAQRRQLVESQPKPKGDREIRRGETYLPKRWELLPRGYSQLLSVIDLNHPDQTPSAFLSLAGEGQQKGLVLCLTAQSDGLVVECVRNFGKNLAKDGQVKESLKTLIPWKEVSPQQALTVHIGRIRAQQDGGSIFVNAPQKGEVLYTQDQRGKRALVLGGKDVDFDANFVSGVYRDTCHARLFFDRVGTQVYTRISDDFSTNGTYVDSRLEPLRKHREHQNRISREKREAAPKKVEIHGGTDVGLRRDNNQDAWGSYVDARVEQSVIDQRGKLLVLADGMGGVVNGEKASKMAIQTVLNAYYGARGNRDQALRRAFLHANNNVIDTGGGTTAVAAVIHENELLVANVGDSRAYLFSNGEFKQLTEDHSLVQRMVRQGELTAEEARTFQAKNVLTQALGQSGVRVDLLEETVESGDMVLLCSEGLWGMITDNQIKSIIEANQTSLDKIPQALIAAANAAGGHDNITAVVAQVK